MPRPTCSTISADGVVSLVCVSQIREDRQSSVRRKCLRMRVPSSGYRCIPASGASRRPRPRGDTGPELESWNSGDDRAATDIAFQHRRAGPHPPCCRCFGVCTAQYFHAVGLSVTLPSEPESTSTRRAQHVPSSASISHRPSVGTTKTGGRRGPGPTPRVPNSRVVHARNRSANGPGSAGRCR